MFIDPKSDVCMKELFRNETVLKYFISAVLEIPPESIRTVRLRNTFLWRRYQKQKQGILNFNLTDRKEYHHIYRLRDQQGHEFSDVLEVHVLELKKKLDNTGDLEDWIRFFRADSEEELNMINTKNPGILEAIREVKAMGLSRRLRLRYEAYLKWVRDENAWKKYEREEARKEGLAAGREEGMALGRTEGRTEIIRNMLDQKISEKDIIQLSGCSREELEEAKRKIKK